MLLNCLWPLCPHGSTSQGPCPPGVQQRLRGGRLRPTTGCQAAGAPELLEKAGSWSGFGLCAVLPAVHLDATVCDQFCKVSNSAPICRTKLLCLEVHTTSTSLEHIMTCVYSCVADEGVTVFLCGCPADLDIQQVIGSQAFDMSVFFSFFASLQGLFSCLCAFDGLGANLQGVLTADMMFSGKRHNRQMLLACWVGIFR